MGDVQVVPAVGLEMLGTFLPFMPFLLVPVAPLCRWPSPQIQAPVTNSAEEQDALCHPGRRGGGGGGDTVGAGPPRGFVWKRQPVAGPRSGQGWRSCLGPSLPPFHLSHIRHG